MACVTYQYKSSDVCHLIVNAAADEVQTFVSDDSNFLYKARIGNEKFFPISYLSVRAVEYQVYWYLVELPYWFKIGCCVIFHEFFPRQTQKITLCEVRFNPLGVKLSGLFPKCFTDFSEFNDQKIVITVKRLKPATEPPLV